MCLLLIEYCGIKKLSLFDEHLVLKRTYLHHMNDISQLHTALNTDLHEVLRVQRNVQQDVASKQSLHVLESWTNASDALLKAIQTNPYKSPFVQQCRVNYCHAYRAVMEQCGHTTYQSSLISSPNGLISTRKRTLSQHHIGGHDSIRQVSTKRLTRKNKDHKKSTQSPTALFKRAWSAFLSAIRKLQHVILIGGRTFLSLLKQAVSLFFSGIKFTLKVVFLPVILMGRILRTGTRVAVRNVLHYWRTAMFFLVIAMGVLIMPNSSIALFKHVMPNKSSHPYMVTHEDQIKSILTTGTKDIASFIRVGVPQFTFDFLRIWHLVLADTSSYLVGLILHGANKFVTNTIGKEYLPFFNLDKVHNASVYYDGLRAYRKTHNHDPLIQAYVQAFETTKQNTPESIQNNLDEHTMQPMDTFFKRYVKGETEAQEDVRQVTVGQMGTSVLTWYRHLPKQSYTPQTKSTMMNITLNNKQQARAAHCIQKWAKRASHCSIYQMLCFYFLFVAGATTIESMNKSLLLIQRAKRTKDFIAAYETMSVSATLG